MIRRPLATTDIAGIIGLSESRTLEFKRDLSSLQPILKVLVAFANTAGGTLVIGREDDGTVTGLADPEREAERLASAVADGIRPLLLPDIELAEHHGKRLLVVRVAWWPGPFFLRAKGPEAGVIVRLGSTNRRADESTLERLRLAPGNRAFDQMPCVGARLDDLDLDSAGRRFRAVGRDLDDATLESLGIVVRHGHERVPSNGGVILFGQPTARSRFFPDARIRCARFVGSDKSQFLDRLDIEGSVLEALDEVPRFIRRNTRLASRIESWVREDIPEYPTLALREAMVNAVAHTDYSQRGMQIMVAVFSDHLEIQSPGAFPFGLSVDDLKAGVSRIRNPVIARVLRELDLMETWGSGYRRIREDCQAGGYVVPEWIELSLVIRVVFRPHPLATEEGRAQSGPDVPDPVPDVPDSVPDDDPDALAQQVRLNARESWFLARLKAGSDVRPRDIAEVFKVSLKTAKRDIAKLKEVGLVRYEGSARGGRYRVVVSAGG